MLLNEFLKDHRKAQVEGRKVAQLEGTLAKQQQQIEALTATVQKVSDQLELNKPAAPVVASYCGAAERVSGAGGEVAATPAAIRLDKGL